MLCLMRPPADHAWSADGEAYPPGWPDQTLGLSSQLGTAGPKIVAVPDVAAMALGAVKDMLRSRWHPRLDLRATDPSRAGYGASWDSTPSGLHWTPFSRSPCCVLPVTQ